MNIIELAKQAGLQTDNAGVWVDDGYIDDQLKAFAALVAAHEREACAKICDDGHLASIAADIIRERGEA
jgi:hypothetical protein